MKKVKSLAIVLLIASCCSAQWRPRLEIVDDWAKVGTNTVREGTVQDVGLWENTTVYIAMGIASTTAHTDGTVFHIQVSPVDSGDEMWLEQASYTMGKGITATPTILNVTPNAGSTTILVPLLGIGTWGRFNDDGIQEVFILGSPTVANSEICTLISHTVGAASSVTMLDGLTNTPGASSTIWDWADTYVYELPPNINRVRVLHDNTYDPDGAVVYTYVALFGISP